jgi:hypothetical protein
VKLSRFELSLSPCLGGRETEGLDVAIGIACLTCTLSPEEPRATHLRHCHEEHEYAQSHIIFTRDEERGA